MDDVLTTDDVNSNPAFGGDTDLQVVIVTDEGDSSRWGTPGDTDVSDYLAAIQGMQPAIGVSVVGPRWDGTDGSAEVGPMRRATTDCAPADMADLLATVAGDVGR